MGFGSYDESEQENQEVDLDEGDDGVSVHENEYEGEVSFDSEESTDDLVDRLAEMKGEPAEE